MYSLLIIDAQPVFKASQKILATCLQEIYQAQKLNCPIVFVEYHWPGALLSDLQTHPVLLAAAQNYSVVIKHQQNGAEVIHQFYQQQYNTVPPLRVCGVNTEMCVLDTVKDLAKFTSIMVVTQACRSSYNHKIGLRLMNKINNVFLV